ncbi:hypothetical protein BJX76DRAFT_335714 [Aspergillus varians]
MHSPAARESPTPAEVVPIEGLGCYCLSALPITVQALQQWKMEMWRTERIHSWRTR